MLKKPFNVLLLVVSEILPEPSSNPRAATTGTPRRGARSHYSQTVKE
jgi:hypothetical protein